MHGFWSIATVLSSEMTYSLDQSVAHTIPEHFDTRSQGHFKFMFFLLASAHTYRELARAVSKAICRCSSTGPALYYAGVFMYVMHFCRGPENFLTHSSIKWSTCKKNLKKKSAVQDRWEEAPVYPGPCTVNCLSRRLCLWVFVILQNWRGVQA